MRHRGQKPPGGPEPAALSLLCGAPNGACGGMTSGEFLAPLPPHPSLTASVHLTHLQAWPQEVGTLFPVAVRLKGQVSFLTSHGGPTSPSLGPG